MSNKAPSKQAGFLVIGQNLASLAEGLMLLAIVRLMGKADVGVLGSLMLIYQTVALIAMAGFPGALMYFMAARPDEERRAIAWHFAGAMLRLGVLAGLLLLTLAALDQAFPGMLSTVGQAGKEKQQAVSLKYLYLMALYPLADLPTRILNNLLVVEKRASSVAKVSIVRAIGQTSFLLTPIALGANLWVVVGSLTAWGYIYASILLYILHTLYRDVRRIPSPIGGKEMLLFALPLGATGIVSLVNARLDQYLILFSFPAAKFAEYQAGAWQIPFVTSLVYPVGAAFMPRWRELFVQGKNYDALTVWRETAVKVSLLVVPISMIFIVAAEETMELLFTSDYVGAAWVFRWYAVWTMGRVATFGNVMTAAGAPGLVLKAALVAIGANAVISPLLLWWIGFEGPAVGTVIAFIPELFAYCWFISKAASVPLSHTFPVSAYLRTVLVATAVGIGAYFLKESLPHSPSLRLSAVSASVVVGFAAVGTITRLILPEDWGYVKGWLRREKNAGPVP